MEADQVRVVLSEAMPELAGPLAENDADPLSQGLSYLEMGALARCLGGRLRADETDGFPRLFDAVERCLLEGTPEAVQLVMVGLLEDLQNGNLTEIEDFSRWEPYLGPVTLGAWSAVAAFWEGDAGAIGRFRVR